MRKNEFEIEKKRRRRTRSRRLTSTLLAAAIATVATAVSSVSDAVAWGQISTATEKGGAGSLLDSTQANGRFSGERYDGAIKPSAKSEESRFSGGTVRGSAGNVVGVDASRAGGRFSGTSDFRSKQNFELFYWRNEILRTRKALTRAESALGGGLKKPDGPRLTTAKEPKPISISEWRRGVRYGRTAEEVAAAREAELAARSGDLPNGALDLGDAAVGRGDSAFSADGGYDPATIWMRGRAPVNDWSGLPFGWSPLGAGAATGVWETETNGDGWVELDGRTRSELAGGLSAPSGAPFASIPELAPVSRSPEEKRIAYQEYLTTRLLQTPTVNPLSPISVEFRNGVATVRGIVPTPSAREAAGRVLLAEPDVRRVENCLTFVRPDGDGPGALVPVAPTPGKVAVPVAPTPGNVATPGTRETTVPPTPPTPLVPILPDVGGAVSSPGV